MLLSSKGYIKWKKQFLYPNLGNTPIFGNNFHVMESCHLMTMYFFIFKLPNILLSQYQLSVSKI